MTVSSDIVIYVCQLCTLLHTFSTQGIASSSDYSILGVNIVTISILGVNIVTISSLGVNIVTISSLGVNIVNIHSVGVNIV